jgi:hypothetical protein
MRFSMVLLLLHGTIVADVSESAFRRHGAIGIDARA